MRLPPLPLRRELISEVPDMPPPRILQRRVDLLRLLRVLQEREAAVAFGGGVVADGVRFKGGAQPVVAGRFSCDRHFRRRVASVVVHFQSALDG